MPEPESERLDDLVLAGVGARHDDPVVVGADGALTGAQFASQVERLAAALMSADIESGQAVLLAVDNHPGDLVAEVAVWRAGGVAVPVHRSSPAATCEDVGRRSAARLIVGPVPAAWMSLVDQEGTDRVARLRIGPVADAPAELGRDQALVIFTSGSTGRPKGVVLSHAAFSAKLRAISSVLDFAPASSTLQVLHLHFSFGQWTSLLTLAARGRADLVQRFSARSVLQRLAEDTYDRIPVVPTMLRVIRLALAEPGGEDLLATLRARQSPRLWIAGGEPLAAGLGRHFRALLPDSQITDVFGLSESSTSDFILRPHEYDTGAGTIGLPSPGVRARVVTAHTDGRFADAAVREAGELWLDTQYRMTGYLGDPAATSATFDGPWLRTGDLARRRDDGVFELAGRAKNLIVRGGTKISPLEVENAFSAHPDCTGVLAVGVPDDVLGERVHLAVTIRRGARFDLQELRDWGSQRLEPYKVPEAVHVLDEFPLGATGKTDRAAVAERVRELSVTSGG
jgi:long-chain acyl-CoA synthetase